MIAYKRMVMSVLRWMLFPVRWLRCRRDGVVHTAGRQTIPNEQLFAVVTEVLREGHTAVIWVKGYSMRPFLEHERDRVKLAAPGQVKVGDAVLAQIAPGRYVLHRILNMDDDRITLQGDGNLVGVEYWIRADETAGYDNGGGSDISMTLSFLPDVKTETTTGVSLPPILKNKWNDQSSGSKDWLVPAAEPYRQELNIAPKDYMVKWITSWVEEFGIDGFRVDTAKHVEIDRWAQLKDEAEVALQTWRENNPDRPGANWDDDFWMTAEVFGHGLGKSEYFDNGFDSVINFDFQKANKNDLVIALISLIDAKGE